jgi:DNA-binding transcriptional ArsR family regulator
MLDIDPDHPDSDSTQSIDARLLRPDVRRILSYLGELKRLELVPVMQIAADLSISYGTCAEHIRYLADQAVVIIARTPGKSMVRLNNELAPAFFAAIVCVWEPEFGTHPSAGRRTQTTASLKLAN